MPEEARKIPESNALHTQLLSDVEDEPVLLTGNHAGGMPSVLVVTTDPDILSWDYDEFDRIYEQSTLASEHA